MSGDLFQNRDLGLLSLLSTIAGLVDVRGLLAGCHSRVKILMPSTPLKLPSVMVELLIQTTLPPQHWSAQSASPRVVEHAFGVELTRERKPFTAG